MYRILSLGSKSVSISRPSMALGAWCVACMIAALTAAPPILAQNSNIAQTLPTTNSVSQKSADADALFDSWVAQAIAYERESNDVTREEAETGKGMVRAERLRYYLEALKARPNDPRNTSVLYIVAQSYFSSFNPKAGETADFASAAYWFEEYLKVADSSHDNYYEVQAILANIYRSLGKRDKALELARNVMLAPFPAIDAPDTSKVKRLKDIPQNERHYILLEYAKSGALNLYYDLTVRDNEKDPSKRLTRLTEFRQMNLGRIADKTLERKENEEQKLLQAKVAR